MTRTCAYAIIDTAGRDAPWLTLVHGATQNRGVFTDQVAHVSPRFRMLLVDLAGHGDSQAVPGPYGPVEYAEGVAGALDAAGVTCTHYWGTHTGSTVGLLLASSDPHCFASMILESPVIPGRDVASIAGCFNRARATLRTHGLDAAVEEWWQCSPWFDQMRREPRLYRAAAHRLLLAEFHGAPWCDGGTPAPVSLEVATLAAINLPVLLYNGEHEVSDFLPMAEELATALPHARRETIPGAGGFPLWEKPQLVNARVQRFLLSVQQRSFHPASQQRT